MRPISLACVAAIALLAAQSTVVGAACPKVDGRVCGKHGRCRKGLCVCSGGYSGLACQTPKPKKSGYDVTIYKTKGCPKGTNHKTYRKSECGGSSQGACTLSGCKCVRPWMGKACDYRQGDPKKLTTTYDKLGHASGTYCFCRRNPTHSSCRSGAAASGVYLVKDKTVHVGASRRASTASKPNCDRKVKVDRKAELKKWQTDTWNRDRDARKRDWSNPLAYKLREQLAPNLYNYKVGRVSKGSGCSSKCSSSYCEFAKHSGSTDSAWHSARTHCHEQCRRKCGEKTVGDMLNDRRNNNRNKEARYRREANRHRNGKDSVHGSRGGNSLSGAGSAQMKRLGGVVTGWKSLYINNEGVEVGKGVLKDSQGTKREITSLDFRHPTGATKVPHWFLAYKKLKVSFSKSTTDMGVLDVCPLDSVAGVCRHPRKSGTATEVQRQVDARQFRTKHWKTIQQCINTWKKHYDNVKKIASKGAWPRNLPWVSVHDLGKVVPVCCVGAKRTCKATRTQGEIKAENIWKQLHGAKKDSKAKKKAKNKAETGGKSTAAKNGKNSGKPKLKGKYKGSVRDVGTIVSWEYTWSDFNNVWRGQGSLKSKAGDVFFFTSFERRCVPIGLKKVRYGAELAYPTSEYQYKKGDKVFFTARTKDMTALDVAKAEECYSAKHTPKQEGKPYGPMIASHNKRLQKNKRERWASIRACIKKARKGHYRPPKCYGFAA